jgi:hypothetical protein
MSLLGGTYGSGEREVNSDAEAFALFLLSVRWREFPLTFSGDGLVLCKVTSEGLLSTRRIGARTGVAYFDEYPTVQSSGGKQ